MRARALLLALALTGCNLDPSAMIGRSPEDDFWNDPVAVGNSTSCAWQAPIWEMNRPSEGLPSICDDLADAFPRIETEGTDGSIKLTTRKLVRGGFPELTLVAYQHREGFPAVEFECGTPVDTADRRSVVCKPKWQHAIGPTQTNPEQIPVEIWAVQLRNPACGNTMAWQYHAKDDVACNEGTLLRESPCPGGISPWGACENGVPAPTLWLSLN